MDIDISTIPWSFYGARFAVVLNKEGKLFLKDVGGGDDAPCEVFSLQFIGLAQTYDPPLIKANEKELSLINPCNPECKVTLKFISADKLKILCKGAGLRLEMIKSRYDYIQERAQGILNIQNFAKDHVYDIDVRHAKYEVDAPWDRVGNKYITINIRDGTSIISEYSLVPEENVTHTEESIPFSNLKCLIPQINDKDLTSAAERALYILWSAVVRPHGRLTHSSIYSSKNWMTNIWSWDNCFCALPFAEHCPHLALSQLLVFADNQDASGAFPDFINDRFISFSCTKPPVHGLALLEIVRRNPTILGPFRSEIEYLYKSISASTEFWLHHRKLPSGALIFRHGNDSGWDNATPFLEGGPVESPDLYALLAKQGESLAEISILLGKDQEESNRWHLLARDLINTMLERLWDSDGFFARRGIKGEKIDHRGSFLLRIPLIAYNLLPLHVQNKLLDDIADEQRFLTQFGIASEALDSPYLEEDGYWRGPVWAPVNFLIAYSLAGCGKIKLARKIAERFVKNCIENGMAENFNPISGKGLDDPAFSWTSAVFLLFLQKPFSTLNSKPFALGT